MCVVLYFVELAYDLLVDKFWTVIVETWVKVVKSVKLISK